MSGPHELDPLSIRVGVLPHVSAGVSIGRALAEGLPVTFLDRMPLREALETKFDSAALFVGYTVLDKDGKQDSKLPRLAKKDERLVEDRGGHVRVSLLAVDYDRPKVDGNKNPWNNPKEPWDLLAKLADTPELWPTVFYSTKHGARLVYVLSRTLTTCEAEQAYVNLLDRLRTLGIESDENTKDWTRMFALPFVTKGEEEPLWENPAIFCETFPDSVLNPDLLLTASPSTCTVSRSTAFVEGDKPDLATCEKLREENEGKLGLFADATDLAASHTVRRILDGGSLRFKNGKRDAGLYAAAMSCAEVLYLQGWASPELVYAFLVLTAVAMPPDADEPGKDWTDVLWAKVCRTWVALCDKEASADDRLKALGIDYALDYPSWDHHENDTTNAQILEHLFGDVIRYAQDSGGFFVYCTDTGRWTAPGRDQAALRQRARVLQYVWRAWQRIQRARVKKLKVQIALAADDDETQALKSAQKAAQGEAQRCKAQANHSAGLRAMSAAIGLLPGQPSLTVAKEGEAFDADPNLLNLRNGVLRLPTKDNPTAELYSHGPEHMCSRQANVEYDPDAKCLKFDGFRPWMLPDPSARDYIQKLAGTYLSGERERQQCLVLDGTGRNGKSTFFDSLQTILGDYAAKAPRQWLTPRGDRQDFSTIHMRGARLVVASETGKGNRMDAARLKEVTGDKFLTARDLYKSQITFQVGFELALLTNEAPEITDDSDGMWRRMKVLPCRATITDDQEDTELTDKLIAEGSGLLNWMIEGLRKYRLEGLQEPQAVVEATGVYRTESDPIRSFLSESLVEGKDSQQPVNELYQAYTWWCAQQQIRVETQRAFCARLWQIYGRRAKSRSKERGPLRDQGVLLGYALRKTRHHAKTGNNPVTTILGANSPDRNNPNQQKGD